MRSLLLTDGKVEIRDDYPIPIPDADEALIRVMLAGICSTDLEMMHGYKGGFSGVLGHEFVGEVVEAPSAIELVGQRVVGEINIGCGQCNLCKRGLAKHCRSRQSLGIVGKDGAFADYLTLPFNNLHIVPDLVSDEAAVFTEPLAAACRILEQVAIGAGDRVTVVGDGRLGLLCVQVLAQTGCELSIVGRHPEYLALLDHIDFTYIHAAASGTTDALSGMDDQFDIVVEASGGESGFATARRLVRPEGAILLKSTFAQPIPDFDSNGLVVDEVRVIGSRCGPFEPALRLLESGAVRVEQMIHGRYPLDRAQDALAYAANRGVLKVLVQP